MELLYLRMIYLIQDKKDCPKFLTIPWSNKQMLCKAILMQISSKTLTSMKEMPLIPLELCLKF